MPDSTNGRLSPLRRGQPGSCTVLPCLWSSARGPCSCARDAEDGDDRLHRRHRLDAARRETRRGDLPARHLALLHRGQPRPRTSRRNGREVHRRRSHGGVRDPGRPRGRRAARGSRRRRDAGGAGRPERAATRGVRDRARHEDRHQHGRGDRRRSVRRSRIRHRGRGRSGAAPGGSGQPRRDPDRRHDAPARARTPCSPSPSSRST